MGGSFCSVADDDDEEVKEEEETVGSPCPAGKTVLS